MRDRLQRLKIERAWNSSDLDLKDFLRRHPTDFRRFETRNFTPDYSLSLLLRLLRFEGHAYTSTWQYVNIETSNLRMT
jgi:hypothetical protein